MSLRRFLIQSSIFCRLQSRHGVDSPPGFPKSRRATWSWLTLVTPRWVTRTRTLRRTRAEAEGRTPPAAGRTHLLRREVEQSKPLIVSRGARAGGRCWRGWEEAGRCGRMGGAGYVKVMMARLVARVPHATLSLSLSSRLALLPCPPPSWRRLWHVRSMSRALVACAWVICGAELQS